MVDDDVDDMVQRWTSSDGWRMWSNGGQEEMDGMAYMDRPNKPFSQMMDATDNGAGAIWGACSLRLSVFLFDCLSLSVSLSLSV